MNAPCCVRSDSKANVDSQAKKDGGTEKETLKFLTIKDIREIKYAFLHYALHTIKVRIVNEHSNLDSVAKSVTC